MPHPQAILSRLGIAARKSLSQNFLTSDHWAEKLASLAIAERPDRIIEIGPGLGALTRKWICKVKEGLIIEYDRILCEFLRVEFSPDKFPNVQLIESDVLRVDMRALCPPCLKTVILSNLPYHISSAIFFSFLEAKLFPQAMVLTFQKEFADRVLAKPHSKDYGALSVLTQTFFSIDPIGDLPSGSFYPKPVIASTALLIRPRETWVDFVHLKNLLRASFAHRRKLLSGNLESLVPKERVQEIFVRLSLPTKSRAEELSKEQYWQVLKALQ